MGKRLITTVPFGDKNHLPLKLLEEAGIEYMIRRKQLEMMKPDAIFINTARGGIISESDLYDVMKSGHLAGTELDVFEKEPYSGQLREIDRCMLTAHMGSMSLNCRTSMEVEAREEAVRFLTGKSLEKEVPEAEYAVQREGLIGNGSMDVIYDWVKE